MADPSATTATAASSSATTTTTTTSPDTQATSSSSSQQQQQQQQQPETCAQCTKSDTEKPLKQCLKCHSVAYCSKECQKAHFKSHKKVCASLAQEYTKTHEPKMASRAPARGGERDRGLQKWQVSGEEVKFIGMVMLM